MSRVLAKVLRHEPELVGLALDGNGYADVDELIRQLNTAARNPGASKRLKSLPVVTLELLCEVVASNDKKRYTFSSDGKKIRAAQGHSIDIDLGYTEAVPPATLYHGTSVSAWPFIESQGLRAMGRKHVHLTNDTTGAAKVGRRHGMPLVLAVAAGEMYRDGAKFWLAENCVWLTEQVPQRFVSKFRHESLGPTSMNLKD